MIYTQSDLETQFSPQRLAEGHSLYSNGLVTAPNVQRGGELVTTVIRPPGARTLRVYVRATRSGRRTVITGECTCRRRRNCEHVAAALLQALADHDGRPVEPSRSAARPAPAARPNPTPKASQQALVYLLIAEADRLLVETAVARRSHHGSWAIVHHYDPDRAADRAPPRFVAPSDMPLLQTLGRLARSPVHGSPVLEGPGSSEALAAMLATGRCFSADPEWHPPLREGAPRAAVIRWEMDDFGRQRTVVDTEPGVGTVLALSAPWYIDKETGEGGRLRTALPAALIRELATMAAVAPDAIDAAYQALLEAHPGAPLPAPQRPVVEAAPPATPVPWLRLVSRAEAPGDDPLDSRDFAVLRFDYGGIALGRHEPDTRRVGDRVLRAARDPAAERAAVAHLRASGLREDTERRRETGADCFIPAVDAPEQEAEAWLDFQAEELPALREHGWRIEHDGFRHRLVEPGRLTCEVDTADGGDWFDIGLGVEVDGRRVDLLPVLLRLIEQFPGGVPPDPDTAVEHFVVRFEDDKGGGLLRLPAQRVLPLLQILLELYNAGADIDELRLPRTGLAPLADLTGDGAGLDWLGDDEARRLAEHLRDVDGIPATPPPAGLGAPLRPYQQRGLDWLQFLRAFRFGGILADDMGLGKTIQALAHLLLEKEAGRADRPSLVVAPTSLMFNWRHEARRFAPDLKVLVLHGPRRGAHFAAIDDHDLVLTTYPLLSRDEDTLLAHSYHLLILDEAQFIKNPRARAGRAARRIEARHRLCLTGTPLENHLGELWSLFDFLAPGLLGSYRQFGRRFRTPIEKHGNEAAMDRLTRRVRPFLLRRTKAQAAPELPEKTEIVQSVALEGQQRELYETVRLAMHQRVRQAIARRGVERSHIIVLEALLKLRQVCCDPRLVDMDEARSVTQSAKLTMLMALLPEMLDEGRRILVFSQFTSMLALIEAELQRLGLDYAKLTGQTRDRQGAVRRFQAGEAGVFLISLKAGGTGLNLTAADTVIHYDPWWNPAVERQATDRAHRIGQDQPVFIYKLICEGTLEEKIQRLQQRKDALAEGLHRDGETSEPRWSEQDLEALFEPLE